jgi:lipid A ethanolaminephosphotransferase
MSSDVLALLAGAYFALACNVSFLRAALRGRDSADATTWLLTACMLLILAAGHTFLVAAVLHRSWARALLAVLVVATAFAVHYMQRYGVYLDPSMLRNVLRTDPAEAGELFSWSMVPTLLIWGGLPLLLLWRVQVVRRPWPRALFRRSLLLLASLATAIAALVVSFQDFSSLMRNQHELRYLITPGNYLSSIARIVYEDHRAARSPRTVLGATAKLDDSWAGRSKPVIFVFVVGETARTANWGLSGYHRQTTPQLAATAGVLNFKDVTSCGTNTEASLPCMFAPVGRRAYDEERIRNSESMLHVLKRAGFSVRWRDNQSGCKGVCEGLPVELFESDPKSTLCPDGRCLDEVLLSGLDKIVADTKGNLFVVLHMLGNHGPAYYRRYPSAFGQFTPTCDTPELQRCSIEQIVNAYDNALLYTDHVLARTIAFLRERSATHDSAMLFVSDHGESLGEHKLFLHGMPYGIAPREQTQVPMVWWLSEGFGASFGLDPACLKRAAEQPAAHDHLFHTTLGLLRVATPEYEPAWDLSRPCRAP